MTAPLTEGAYTLAPYRRSGAMALPMLEVIRITVAPIGPTARLQGETLDGKLVRCSATDCIGVWSKASTALLAERAQRPIYFEARDHLARIRRAQRETTLAYRRAARKAVEKIGEVA